MKLCESCRYRNNTEYEKPCIVYREDCEFYEKERGDMTREQAIYYLQSSGFSEEQIATIERAFKQEPCGDAISRQAVLERLKKEDKILYTTTGLNYLIRAIGELPSVNPQEPKTGYWEKIQSGDKDFPESIVCSRCGHENSYLDFGISSVPIGKSFKKSKFCPNCGAKMIESEDKG